MGGLPRSELGMGPLWVMVGCLFLLADLGRPGVSYLIPKRPGRSWISRGFLILAGFIVLGILQSSLWIWPLKWMEDFGGGWKVLGLINGMLALLTCLYPGLLLGASPIPFWNTPILPVLFMVSGVSTGIAAIQWVGQMTGAALSPEGIRVLGRMDVVLLGTELLLLALYIHGMRRVPAAKASVEGLLCGRWSGLFWTGLIGAGLVLPLGLDLFGVSRWISSPAVLLGGVLLRYLVIKGGVKGDRRRSLPDPVCRPCRSPAPDSARRYTMTRPDNFFGGLVIDHIDSNSNQCCRARNILSAVVGNIDVFGGHVMLGPFTKFNREQEGGLAPEHEAQRRGRAL